MRGASCTGACWIIFVLLLFAVINTQADPGIYKQEIERLQRILNGNILPFWYPEVIDHEYGGYRLNHDARGNYRGAAPKGIIPQARTLWFFSRLHNSGMGNREHLDAARHGFLFLREKLWDAQHGGFYWEVEAPGHPVKREFKDLVGNAFGLYALAEFYIATGDQEALALAKNLFRLLEEHAWDPLHGGYLELFQRDWTLPPDDMLGGISRTHQYKTIDTHLHLMEAVTRYYDATREPVARERLLELLRIQTNAVIRKDLGAATGWYARDWTPLRGGRFERVSYGHDLENIWLIIRACRSANISVGPYRDLFRASMRNALKYGFDREKGRFYYYGPAGGHAVDKKTAWWVTAEAMAAAIHMYNELQDEQYWALYQTIREFAENKQIDWQNGGWHMDVLESGETRGYKAGPWKTPYHSGRAVIESIEVLQAMLRAGQ